MQLRFPNCLRIFPLFVFLLSQGLAQPCDTLFILQDAGETNALLPVIEKCLQNHNSFLILSGGVATEILQREASLKNHITTFAALGIEESLDKSWKRDHQISEESLAKIQAALPAKRLVTGVAFEFQGQLLKAYQASTFAYWDNLNTDGTDLYFQTAKKVAKLAAHLMVPSEFFKPLYPDAAVVGQPTFEKWKGHLQLINQEIIKQKLPFPITSPVILFVGGYGDEYNEALAQFLTAAEHLSDWTILLSVHPKFAGKIEKEELLKRSLPHVHIADQITTIEAVSLSSHVVCHQSTVGIQAAFAEKAVIYWIPQGQTYTNLLIQNNIVPKVSSLEEFEKALLLPHKEADLFTLLKIPTNSPSFIYTYIKKH